MFHPPKRTSQANSENACYEEALHRLSRQLMSKLALQNKLGMKGYNQICVQKVIRRLEGENILNDTLLAENYIHNLIAYKKYGYYKIKLLLLKKGFSPQLCTRVLEQMLDVNTETKLANSALAKIQAGSAKELAYKLKSRGFRTEVIMGIVKAKQTM